MKVNQAFLKKVLLEQSSLIRRDCAISLSILTFPKKLLKYWREDLKKRNALVLVRKSLFTAPGKANYFLISRQTTGLLSDQMLKGFFFKMGIHQYRPKDRRLFIDSSKQNLECVLLHNGNKCKPIPFGYSTKLSEGYNNIKDALKKMS